MTATNNNILNTHMPIYYKIFFHVLSVKSHPLVLSCYHLYNEHNKICNMKHGMVYECN